ncbi:MAG: head GIN domain-containing protein [Flavobacteriaceae bacterium]
MKKWTFYLILIFGGQVLCSQNEEITVSFESFTQVKAYDGLSVNLIKSSENKAVISGANTKNVAVVNIEGVLKLRMQVTKLFSGYRTFIDLYYTDPLVVIDVNEDARISSEETIVQDVLEIKAQEGGEVIIDARVEQLLIKSVTGGIITATGSSQNQDVAINTGGTYNGKEFKTKFTTVNVNAGSMAEINATDYVKATVKAGGEVQVYGDPAKMDEKTVFGGKVLRM